MRGQYGRKNRMGKAGRAIGGLSGAAARTGELKKVNEGKVYKELKIEGLLQRQQTARTEHGDL